MVGLLCCNPFNLFRANDNELLPRTLPRSLSTPFVLRNHFHSRLVKVHLTPSIDSIPFAFSAALSTTSTAFDIVFRKPPLPSITLIQTMTSAPSPNSRSHPPQARGIPPWERNSALPNPNDPQTQAQAERWHKAAANFDTHQRHEHRRRRRAERTAARRQREREEMQQNLEANARRMYYIGFCFLPLVWLITLIYFYREHRTPDASPIIKKCTLRLLLSLFRNVSLRYFC